MPTWPATVPFRYDASSYSEPRTTGVIRTPFDTGRGKTRRRFLNSIVVRQLTLVLTTEEKDALMDFIDDDIDGGATAFQWYNPNGGALQETVKLLLPRGGTITPRKLRRRAGQRQRWSVQITAEVQP